MSFPKLWRVVALVMVCRSVASGQVAPINIGHPRGALSTIESPEELSHATFDSTIPTFSFSRPGSPTMHYEPVSVATLPISRDVPYRMKATKNAAGDVLLSDPRLELVAKWHDAAAMLPDHPGVSALAKTITQIPAGALTIPNELRPKLERETASVISSLPKDAPARDLAIDSWYLAQKSYHNNNHIPFSVFEGARKVCLATCAIKRNGKAAPHGSGVLIGKNLVLTCKHNFEGADGPAAKCHIIFHFTDADRGAAYTVNDVYYCSDTLDFCLIELGEVAQEADDSAFIFPSPPALGVEPELVQNAGIYVAGYPEGRPLSVALNSEVVYPFYLDTKTSVTNIAQTAILRMFLSPADFKDNEKHYSPLVERFFAANYKPGAMGFFFRPGNYPTIGADPDTKHGNSGGPAFDIERNALVGLLRAGAPDDGDFPAGANYANFEAIIPISQIVGELDASAEKNWKSRFAITYFGE